MSKNTIIIVERIILFKYSITFNIFHSISSSSLIITFVMNLVRFENFYFTLNDFKLSGDLPNSLVFVGRRSLGSLSRGSGPLVWVFWFSVSVNQPGRTTELLRFTSLKVVV